jgi:CBS domain containing-hemolysin-like protein
LFGTKKKDRDEQSEQVQQAEIEERRDMIEGIGELEEKTVKEVMVPRIDVQFIPVDISLDEFYGIIGEQGYSRYPVYDDTIDNVIGILYAKDLLRPDIEDNFDVRQLMRKAYFVPESKHLDDLLREFKLRKVHIAVAIDEYGGVSGIICMEDILEVIVGEIQDEFDEDEAEDISELQDGEFLCEARTPIDEINSTVGLHLPEDDFETLGGYVFELFGRIPAVKEQVEDSEAVFIVEDIDGHKINRVRIIRKQPE